MQAKGLMSRGEPSPKRRKESLAVKSDDADEQVVRTYLQKLCDGEPQKLAALAGMEQKTVTDDLQEPAEMYLANAIIKGAELLDYRQPSVLTQHQLKKQQHHQ